VYLGKLFIPLDWEIEKVMRYVRTELIMDKTIELEAWEEFCPGKLICLPSQATVQGSELGDGDIVIVQDLKTLSIEPSLGVYLGAEIDNPKPLPPPTPKKSNPPNDPLEKNETLVDALGTKQKQLTPEEILSSLSYLRPPELEKIISEAMGILKKKNVGGKVCQV